MVTDEVSLLEHPPDKRRVCRKEMRKNEKRSGNVLLFQRIEDLFDVAVLIPRVKRQIDRFFVAGIGVITVVVGKTRKLNGKVRRSMLRIPFHVPSQLRIRRVGTNNGAG